MKITVACDGSEHSLQALRLAAHLPFQQPHYHLVNVAPVIEYDPKEVGEPLREQIDEFNRDTRLQADHVLDAAEGILKDHRRESFERSAFLGSALEKLVELSHTSDLVVVGSRGLNPLQELLLGSVSDGLLRHAYCPVLLFRGGDRYAFPARDLDLVVGYDDTAPSREACEFLRAFASDHVRSIDLVAVSQTSFFYGMSSSLTALREWPLQRKALAESLAAMKRELSRGSAAGAVLTEIVGDASDAASELNRYAKNRKKHLIIVGSRGKSLMDRVFLGSTSSRLAHHSDVPILVVR